MKNLKYGLLLLLILSACSSAPKLPQDPDALFSLGQMSLAQGKYKLAQQAFLNFTIRFPTHPKATEAQFLLAESYYRDRNWEEAISEYRFLLDNYPKNPFREEAFLHMAASYLKKSPPPYLDQTETERAVDMLRNFLGAYPDSPFAPEARELLKEAKDKLAQHLLISAKTYIALEHYESARLFLEELIKSYPKVPTAWKARVILSEVLIKLGERDDALSLIKEVIDDPEVPDSIKLTAIALRKTLQ